MFFLEEQLLALRQIDVDELLKIWNTLPTSKVLHNRHPQLVWTPWTLI